ncbi:Hypothetical protein A7982_05334 [Minicystis rosea]|nr:Hypothetical protein A7982_05334 [Minicystis rosea]
MAATANRTRRQEAHRGPAIGEMMATMRRTAAIFSLAALSATACTTYNEAPKCVVGADCASGICNANGTCADAPTGSGGAGGTGGTSGTGGEATSSTTASSSSGGGAGGSAPSCSPNNDGVITRQEVPLAAGLHATFRVADDVTFDTAGVSKPDGSRTWDVKVAFSGDHALLVDTQAIAANAWYAADFPGATYTARMSDVNSDLLGVFKLTSTDLLLLGVVSINDGATATKLVYGNPIVLLAFPLTNGKTWDTLSAVTGKVQGIPIGGIYNEEYTSTVDAHGTYKTPYSDFQVLRVHTKLLRYLNGTWLERHTHTFVTECFGTVGTIVSQDYETKVDFTSASELWRFAP